MTVCSQYGKEWLAHVEIKQLHFEAAAQYRKSIDDLETNKYGHELARLLEAKALAKRGYDLARKSYIAKPVINDIKVGAINLSLCISYRNSRHEHGSLY